MTDAAVAVGTLFVAIACCSLVYGLILCYVTKVGHNFKFELN